MNKTLIAAAERWQTLAGMFMTPFRMGSAGSNGSPGIRAIDD